MGEGHDDYEFNWTDTDYLWLQTHFKISAEWVHTNACMGLGIVREYTYTDTKFRQACEGGYDVSKPVVVRAGGVPEEFAHDLDESKKWFEANHKKICGDASIPRSKCTAVSNPMLSVNDGSHRIYLFNKHHNAEHRGRVYALILWAKRGFWTEDMIEWYALTCNEKSTTNNAVTDFDKMLFVLRCGSKGYTNVKTQRLIVAWQTSSGNSVKLLLYMCGCVCVSLGNSCLFLLTSLLDTRLHQSYARRHQKMDRVRNNPSLAKRFPG
jgi:hypothetical protein